MLALISYACGSKLCVCMCERERDRDRDKDRDRERWEDNGFIGLTHQFTPVPSCT